MARFLFVVPPFVGHVFPTLGMSEELQARGHETAWVSFELIREHLPDQARFYRCEVELPDEVISSTRERVTKGGMIGLQSHWQGVVVPLTHAMFPAVEAAIADFKPDVLVVDREALGGALAARKTVIPWATSSATAELSRGGQLYLPNVETWIQDLLAELQSAYGLTPVPSPEVSDRLVFLYTIPELIPPDEHLPAQYRPIGLITTGRRREGILPDSMLEDRRRVHVSLGTIGVYRGGPFFQKVFEALGDLDMQVIISAPDGLVGAHPDNVLVRPWVDLETLLPKMDAVVTHGGSTAKEALLHGKPLVVAPITSDQPIMADSVAAAGAGLRISFTRSTAEQIREAVLEVLDNPEYTEAAGVLAESFRRAGGVKGAADELEALIPKGA